MTDLDEFAFPTFQPGSVWLVGAGPGDPGLLTLHALRAMEQADVIVADALVSTAILDLVPEHVDIQHMGKRGGRPSPKQGDISARLVSLARQGQKVTRLKGGDPFVFGRGGEEALALVEAGIDFRVVPGITAAIAGTAYAGIPVTTRETNSVISFVTGHDKSGETPDVDWEALAKASPGIVFYMPMNHLDAIRERLLKGGRSAAEPVVLVSKATLPEQQVVDTTLGSFVEDAHASGIRPPVILVLGEMVRLRQKLDWWETP